MPAPIDWTAETERVMRDERERLVAIDDVESHVVYGDPGQELASFAAGVDLLIVGSRGQGRIGRWLSGSVSTYLARRARCPLLVLPRCLTGPTLAWEQELSELSPVLTARAH
jgi:nucleotide-binding universal stress UspA family protein